MKIRARGLARGAWRGPRARGTKIADLSAIGGTLDYVVPDIDR